MVLYQCDAMSVDFGARLRKLRKVRNMFMGALATQSGLSANALSMIEPGSFTRGMFEGLGGEIFVRRLEQFVLTLESRASGGASSMTQTGHKILGRGGIAGHALEDRQIEKERLIEPLFASFRV